MNWCQKKRPDIGDVVASFNSGPAPQPTDQREAATENGIDRAIKPAGTGQVGGDVGHVVNAVMSAGANLR